MEMKNRKANRMREYDYSRPGHYFVTICVQGRKELFGGITNDRMVTNAAGEMVEETWRGLPKFYRGIRMDEFQAMPNHVHGIIVIPGNEFSHGTVGTGLRCDGLVGTTLRGCPSSGQAQRPVPTGNDDRNTRAGPGEEPRKDVPELSDIVHRFKSWTTHQYMAGVGKDGWEPFDGKLWQRSFFDHVIRNEEELNRIREYIRNNPLKWAFDRYNPAPHP